MAPGIPPMAHISITHVEYGIPRFKKRLNNAKIINPIIVFIIAFFTERMNRKAIITASSRTIGSIISIYFPH